MPEMGLAGKVAIVTGAGSRADGIGNGRAAAILLAREGVKVGLLDANKAWAEATKAMIDKEGGTSIVLEADVTNEASAKAAIDKTVATWGHLDILVNNVGISGPVGTAVEVDIAAWDAAMRINVTSMVIMAKYAIPEMRKVGGGSIVNQASIAGMLGGHRNLLYATSKGTIIQLTRGMAANHGEEGIRVNAVAPGLVYTPMVYTTPAMNDTRREERRNASLLGTEGTGWDIGKAIVYLVSDQARWVTGVTLPVDAGVTAAFGSSLKFASSPQKPQ